MRRAHLREDFVQPLQGPVQMYLDPTGGAGHILTVVFCTPTLNKAHADGTHLGELVDDLKAVVDRLGEELSKQLVVEDLEAAAAGDLAHGGGVEAVLKIAVAALDEDAAVAQALGVHLSAHVVQV